MLFGDNGVYNETLRDCLPGVHKFFRITLNVESTVTKGTDVTIELSKLSLNTTTEHMITL